MGYRELIEALRREGEERRAALCLETEAEAARLEAECAAELEAIGRRQAQLRQTLGRREAGLVLAEARRQADQLRLEAENRLAGRCSDLARSLLPEMGSAGGSELFGRLAAELFAAQWQTVRVRPGDAAEARRLFPQAVVESDAALAGGLQAAAGEGRVLIDNTLEKRLERGWPELLPALRRAVER